MKWVITKDRINADVADEKDKQVGKGTVPLSQAAKLPDRFRLRDDDGETYFEGKCDFAGADDGDSQCEPLDCLGVGWGCTDLQEYDKVKKRWVSLV